MRWWMRARFRLFAPTVDRLDRNDLQRIDHRLPEGRGMNPRDHCWGPRWHTTWLCVSVIPKRQRAPVDQSLIVDRPFRDLVSLLDVLGVAPLETTQGRSETRGAERHLYFPIAKSDNYIGPFLG